MSKFKTEQEIFWAGEFGNQYVSRNVDRELKRGNLKFFTKILAKTKGVNSVIEFGANVGLNLLAIKKIKPRVKLSAIEINKKAASQLNKVKDLVVYHQSILDFMPDKKWDMVLIKGVLIHLNPKALPAVYDKLYQSSGEYICVAEHYNPTPVSVDYRGNKNRLFKRDFAGEMLDRFPNLKLVDYGFEYHRENKFYDDLTWFLLKK